MAKYLIEVPDSVTEGDLVRELSVFQPLVSVSIPLEHWMGEGEKLFGSVERGAYGALIGIAFSMGAWWADRPWRTDR